MTEKEDKILYELKNQLKLIAEEKSKQSKEYEKQIYDLQQEAIK